MGLRVQVVRTPPSEGPRARARVASAVRAVPTLVPRGWTLSEASWRSRHRGILVVLWFHVVAVPVFGLFRGVSLRHVLLEASAIAVLAAAASSRYLSRRTRMVAASIGLLTASAVLVHLSQGSIEAHFHFFVMVPLIALYQDWVPFLIAIAYVALHHGVAGSLDPRSVFNHPAAYAQPWKWALIHAFFIAGISAVCLTTWRLLEAALQRATAEAQVKSEFLSVLSHEIRTPLTAVIGYTGLLADAGLSEQQREYAHTIRRSSDHLLTLINDILDYSKLEAGRLELDDAPFDVLHLVDDTMGLVAESARKQGIALSSLCENSVPNTAVGDSGRIAQILLNLASNAVKFTERGEVSVRVTGRPIGNDRHELTIAVRDTGIGIEAENLERLFDSFQQAEKSISRRYGGTGLGLAIAKQLCELMGGRLEVESTPGVGSTFSATVVVKVTRPDWKRHDVSRAFRGLGVIVVGQSAHTEVLVQLLAQWGAPTRPSTPSEALLRVRSGAPADVVFVVDPLDGVDPATFALELRACGTAKPLHIALVADASGDVHPGVFDSVLWRPLRQSHVYDLLMSLRAGTPEITDVGGSTIAEQYPLRVLVAEDNHVNQKVLTSQLRNLGYDADSVTNGAEAVDAVRLRNYDVVLMDVHMPEMDGVTATRAIREQSAEPPLIIAVSADATQEMKAACLDAGADDYVTKPVKAPELAAALVRNAQRRAER